MSETCTCEKCDQSFEPGDWFCPDGSKHIVAEKSYFLPGDGRTIVTNIPPPDMTNFVPGADDGGLGGCVEFIDSRFSTTDPEQQYWLNERQLRGGFVTKEEWQRARLSPQEIEVAELEAVKRGVEQLRIENDRLRARAAK